MTTLMKLLFGQNVDSEIRLRYIKTDNTGDICSVNNNNELDNKLDTAFVEKWDSINKLNEKNTKLLTKNTYNNIDNKELQDIIKTSFLWNEYMNLYNHNCQHFSKYVYKIYLSSKNK